jgi:hypothetical protein
MDYTNKYNKYLLKHLALEEQIASGTSAKFKNTLFSKNKTSGKTNTSDDGKKCKNKLTNIDEKIASYIGCVKDKIRNGHGITYYKKITRDDGITEQKGIEGKWIDNILQIGDIKIYNTIYTKINYIKIHQGEEKKVSLHGNIYETIYEGTNAKAVNEYDVKKEGIGTMTIYIESIFRNYKKATYEGNWKDDKRHGEGKITNMHGDVLEGTWENDNLLNGTLKFSDKSIDITDLELLKKRKYMYWDFTNPDSIQNKYIILDQKGIYEGKFENYKRHGKGKMTNKHDDVFEGEWSEDKLVKGTLKFSGTSFDVKYVFFRQHDYGGTYEGQFEDYKRHGKGKMVYTNLPKIIYPTINKNPIRLIEFDGEWNYDIWKKGILTYKEENNTEIKKIELY